MRGHLEARGKNTWRAKVYLGRDVVTGNKRYLTRTLRGTKRQAEDQLNQLLVDAGRSQPVVTDGTFADLAQRWLDLAASGLSPTTLAEYERLLDRLILPRFAKAKVQAMRASDLDSFYANLTRRGGAGGGPLGAQSVQHVHALIRRLLNQAVKWGWIVANPATSASPPRVHRHEPELPSPASVVHLLETAAERDPDIACFLRLSAVTGARRGELCAIRWDDFDGAEGCLHIRRAIVGGRQSELVEKDTKTHAARRVSLDAETLSCIAEHRARCRDRAAECGVSLPDNAFVFSNAPDGATPWRPGRVTLAFGRLCGRAGVTGVRLHDLRHFAATQLLAAGVPVKTVAGRLGHANAATTLNVYAHVLESSDAAAAQVLGDLLAGEPEEPAPDPHE